MEYVGSVLMDIYTAALLGIDIASDMRPLVDKKALLSLFYGLGCEYRSVEAGSNYEIIVHVFLLS